MAEDAVAAAVPAKEEETVVNPLGKVEEQGPSMPAADGERPPPVHETDAGEVAGNPAETAQPDSADEATEDDMPLPLAKGPHNGAGSQGGSPTAAGQLPRGQEHDEGTDHMLDDIEGARDGPQGRSMGRQQSGDSGALCRNHTGYIGVRKRNWGMYAAEIRDGAKRRWLGSFSQAREAGMAYDAALILQKKHRAKTNFVYSDFVTMPRPGAELAGKVRYSLIPKDIMEMYKEQFKEVMEIITAGDYEREGGSGGERSRKRSHSPPPKSQRGGGGSRLNSNSNSNAQRNMQQFMMRNNMMPGGMMGGGMMNGGGMMGGGMMGGGPMMGNGMMGNGMMNGMDAMFTMGSLGDLSTPMRMGRGGMMMGGDGSPSASTMPLAADMMMMMQPQPTNSKGRSSGRNNGVKGSGDAAAAGAGGAGMDATGGMFLAGNMAALFPGMQQQQQFGMRMGNGTGNGGGGGGGQEAEEEEEEGQGGEDDEEEEEEEEEDPAAGGAGGFNMMGNPFMQPGMNFPMMGLPPGMMGMGNMGMSFPNQMGNMGNMSLPFGFPGGFPGNMYQADEETEDEEGEAGDMDPAAFMSMYNAQMMSMMPNMGRNQVPWQQEMFGGRMGAMCMPNGTANKRQKTRAPTNVKAK